MFKQALNHALKIEEIPVHPTLRSPAPFGYRHRLQLKTIWEDNRLKLGFFKHKSHQVVPIDRCLLANGAINEVLRVLGEKIQALHYREWTPEIEIQVFDQSLKGGIIFKSPHRLEPSQRKKIIKELLPIPGLSYLLFQEPNHLLYTGEPLSPPEEYSPEYSLPGSETGLIKDIRLTCFPGVFTQINLDLNRRLINRLISLNLFDSQDTVLDLYCGLGNFSLPLALQVKEVIGIETNPRAVTNARWNQKINRISNCTLIEAKAEDAVRQLERIAKSVSWVILDPPRTGAQEVISLIDTRDLKGILYISCDPMTLFRDLTYLTQRGWMVQWSQPVDFFPQTFHLESITLLRKADAKKQLRT